MRLRQRQWEVFSRLVNLDELERGCVGRLRRFAPVDAALLGDAELRAAARALSERAWDVHGLCTPELLLGYVEVALTLGGGFDTDPLLPWAASALGRAGTPAIERLRAVQAGTRAHVEAVAGPDRALGATTFERLAAAWRGDAAGRPSDAGTICPERAADLAAATAHARGAVDVFGLEPRACPLVAASMLVLGHALARDPTLPWLARATHGASTPRERTSRWAEAIAGHLEHHLEARRVRAIGRS